MEKPNLQQNEEFAEFLAKLALELNLDLNFETKVCFDKWDDDFGIISQSCCYIKGVCIPEGVSNILMKHVNRLEEAK